ncbi:unnamed protein product, partial [Lymnaea stagnalis]
MKIKKDNGVLSSKVADISTFTLAERNPRMKNISPGNISLDDFKPNKNFISLGKLLVKDKNNCETIYKSESDTVTCNSNGVGKEKKKEAMLKDVIPSFQTHSASTSMAAVQSKERSNKKAKKSESFMTSGSERSSFLPELNVELEASKQNEKDCEVIAETQIEQPSATLERETIAYRSLNKQNQEINKQVTLSKLDTVTQMK